MEWGKGIPKEREVNRRREVCDWGGECAENARVAHEKTPLGPKALFFLPSDPYRVCRIPAAELGIFSLSRTTHQKIKKTHRIDGQPM